MFRLDARFFSKTKMPLSNPNPRLWMRLKQRPHDFADAVYKYDWFIDELLSVKRSRECLLLLATKTFGDPQWDFSFIAGLA